nr:MAG TPA: hypothetical protein [Caudoviricetes sp.]
MRLNSIFCNFSCYCVLSFWLMIMPYIAMLH